VSEPAKDVGGVGKRSKSVGAIHILKRHDDGSGTFELAERQGRRVQVVALCRDESQFHRSDLSGIIGRLYLANREHLVIPNDGQPARADRLKGGASRDELYGPPGAAQSGSVVASKSPRPDDPDLHT